MVVLEFKMVKEKERTMYNSEYKELYRSAFKASNRKREVIGGFLTILFFIGLYAAIWTFHAALSYKLLFSAFLTLFLAYAVKD